MHVNTSWKTARKTAIAGVFIGLASLGVAAHAVDAQEAGSLAVTGIDLAGDTAVITNSGAAEVDVNGLILCNFPTYQPIAGADPIPAGGSITVDVGALGIDLADDQGELAIYSESSFEDPNAIISYVEWGTADHMRSPVAVEAGIWDGNPVDAAPTLTATVDNPTSAADWGTTATDSTQVLAETGGATWLLAGLAATLIALGVSGTLVGRRRSGQIA